MIDTLGRVLIFFCFIGLGALLVRLKRLLSEGLDGLSAYFYWLAFPAFLISTFTQLPHPDQHLLAEACVYTLAMIAASAVCYVVLRFFREPATHCAGAGMAGMINNSAFLGIPITISLFGPQAAHIGAFVVACDFIALFGLGCATLAYASGHGLREAFLRTVKNPTVIASVAGIVMMLTNLHFPPTLQNGLEMLGHTASPVALVALGGMLGLLPSSTLLAFDRSSAVAVATKTLIAPALVALLLGLWGAPSLVFKVYVFLSACPTAVSVFIQTRVYNTWPSGAAVAIAQSTVLSLMTLSALALVLTTLP